MVRSEPLWPQALEQGDCILYDRGHLTHTSAPKCLGGRTTTPPACGAGPAALVVGPWISRLYSLLCLLPRQAVGHMYLCVELPTPNRTGSPWRKMSIPRFILAFSVPTLVPDT